MRERLHLYLFGGLRVTLGDRTLIDLHTPRRLARALLAYLYLERDRFIPQEELIEALWPDADEFGASRLKQTVFTLRGLIEPKHDRVTGWRFIRHGGGSYYFNTHADYTSDLEDFQRELTLAGGLRERGDTDPALRHLQRALALRRGALLPEFQYEPWLVHIADRVHSQYLAALDDAATLYATRGEYRAAIELLEQAVREDPLREPSYHSLMVYLRAEGRVAEAVRLYQEMSRLLAEQVQVAPSPMLTRLYESLVG